MAPSKLGLRLVIVAACLSPGCASTGRYPFQQQAQAQAKPPRIQQKTKEPADEYINNLERDVNMYSD